MKTIIGLGTLLFCFVFAGCFSIDDPYYGRTVNLEIQDAFSFENKKEYVLGDTLFFELSFSRYLPEKGFNELLDVFETVDSEDFAFSFGFEQYSAFENGFRSIYLNEQFIIAEKKNPDNYHYSNHAIVATLNKATDMYGAQVGIIMAEPGRFRLNFENITLNSPYVEGGIQININHIFTNSGLTDTEFEVFE